jgi:(p)ppGpp synthase/HD superfamily hydrolase
MNDQDKRALQLEYKALVFAAGAHGSVLQVRKYTGVPYIYHPMAVADRIRQSVIDHTPEMLAAAYLHDVLEDTPTTYDELITMFGWDVAELVNWVTDVSRPQDGNRAFRKQKDLEHLADAPSEAQTIKLADLLDNSTSIVMYDKDFARVYLKEKEALLEVLTKGDPVLYSMCRSVVKNSWGRL